MTNVKFDGTFMVWNEIFYTFVFENCFLSRKTDANIVRSSTVLKYGENKLPLY